MCNYRRAVNNDLSEDIDPARLPNLDARKDTRGDNNTRVVTSKPLTSRDFKLRSNQTMCPVLRSVYLVIGLVLMVSESLDAFTIHARDDNNDNFSLTIHPSNVSSLLYDESIDVHLTVNYTGRHDIGLKFISHDKHIAETDNQIYTVKARGESNSFHLRRDAHHQHFLNESIRINGIFLGRTYLQFFTNISLFNTSSSGESSKDRPIKSKNWYQMSGVKYPVVVIREDGPLNHTFLATVIILVVLANIAMGCKVDLNVVKETMKRPVAPCIGLFSQFVIMPMLGFAVSQMFNFDPIIALALLATGCAPGGGASNTYTFLTGGNVSLSVTMTLISTLASLGMIPLWLFTLGSLYVYRDATFTIPYKNVLMSLIGLIIPVIIGLVIQRKRPQWVKKLLRAILPLMILMIILILSVGIYANLYIFRVFQPKVIAAGALLPNAGFLLGGLLAIAFMQPWTDVKTIAIETGLQNTGVPIVLLLSLPKPESDLAIVAPVAAALFTPIILWVFIVIRVVRKRWCRNRKLDKLDVVASKCQHTNLENDKFIENIPCLRTEKTPPDCPAEKLLNETDSDATDVHGMNGTVINMNGHISHNGTIPSNGEIPTMNGNIPSADIAPYVPNGCLKLKLEQNGKVCYDDGEGLEIPHSRV